VVTIKRQLCSLAITLMASTAVANPTLLGLSTQMSLDEQIATLTNQGFECRQTTALLGLARHTCRQGESVVEPNAERIRFSCEVFEACTMTYDALAQLLADNGVVSDVAPEQEEMNMLGNVVKINKACGRTPTNERLCVREKVSYTSGQVTPEVELSAEQ